MKSFDDKPAPDGPLEFPELRVLAWIAIFFLFALAFAFVVAGRVQAFEENGSEGRPLLALLPVHKEDRAADGKREQLEVIAVAVDDAVTGAKKWPGTRSELKALLYTVGWHESGFVIRIGEGLCRPHECDRGRARGYWQQHANSTSSLEAWQQLAGPGHESTAVAAREAARALTRARNQCRSLERLPGDWLPMTLSAYAGRGCVGWFKGRESRIATYTRLVTSGRAS